MRRAEVKWGYCLETLTVIDYHEIMSSIRLWALISHNSHPCSCSLALAHICFRLLFPPPTSISFFSACTKMPVTMADLVIPDTLHRESLTFDPLDGSNYASWKKNMRILLMRMSLLDLVDHDRPRDATVAWDTANNWAFSELYLPRPCASVGYICKYLCNDTHRGGRQVLGVATSLGKKNIYIGTVRRNSMLIYIH